MAPTVPPRSDWKRDLARYRRIDRARSLRQIASVVPPYIGVLALASILRPSAWLSIGLGVVATALLVRMYSLFHDLTHNSLFETRAANGSGGTCSDSCCSRRTGGGSGSTASTTRTAGTSTDAVPARSTR